jgi:CRISPR-associated endoribonuclease Cas6
MERERSEYNRAQRDKTAIVTPERTYDLRVTLLSSRLEEVAQEWTPEHIGLLDLDGTDWQVEHVLCDEEADPWSGHASYETIAAPALLHAEQIPAHWTLEFDSPVTFRQHGINQPFPLPWLVFGSLLVKWNAFAPLALPEDIRRFASECIAVSRYNMRSQAEPTRQGALQTGSVGRCTYTATNRDRYWLACIETLAQFAFFSGIGATTTRGMGRARLV